MEFACFISSVESTLLLSTLRFGPASSSFVETSVKFNPNLACYFDKMKQMISLFNLLRLLNFNR